MNEHVETLKEIKQDFFKFRNGVVAENLKKLYPEGTVIFGLTAPDFTELSGKYPHDFCLAESLWKESKSREGRILALYLFPWHQLNIQRAKALFESVRSREEAEILAFKVLRNLSFAKELLEELSKGNIQDSNQCYGLEMFRKNLENL